MGLAQGSLLGEVVVYDRENHVGGSECLIYESSIVYLTRMIGTTTVFPHGDERLRPIELGASIFVSANRHLVKGAKVRCAQLLDPCCV